MHFSTHQRDLGDAGGRRRDHQGVVVHLVDQGADAVTQGAEHGDGRGDDQQYSQQDQQGRCLALFSTEPRGKTLVERIEGDRQNEGPQHHVHEGGEYGKAERAQCQDKTELDEHIQESGNQPFFDYGQIVIFHCGVIPISNECTTIRDQH
ncbi:hypothetical protein D3C80_988420 [compost metagenome]